METLRSTYHLQIYPDLSTRSTIRDTIIIVIIWLLGSVSTLLSQDTQPLYRHYTTDDGLPSSEVYRVLQDNDGYMWFATDNGVSRFNGYKFENYGLKEGLTDVVALDMKLDDEGTIWIRTLSNKFFHLKKNSSLFEPYKYNDIILKQLPHVINLNQFHIKPKSDELLLTIVDFGFLTIDSSGKCRYDIKNCPNDCLHLFNDGTTAISVIKLKNSNSSKTIFSDRPSGNLNQAFLLKDSTVLVSFTNKLLHFSKNEVIDSSDHPYIGRIYEDEVGNIFEYGIRNGIRAYKNVNDLIHRRNVSALLDQFYITDIKKDKSGHYWITTLYNGVILVPDFENRKIYPKSTDNEKIYDVAITKKNIWLIGNGFKLLKPFSSDFTKNNNDKKEPVRANKIFYYDSLDLLLYSEYGTYNFLALKDNFEQYKVSNSNFNTVTTIGESNVNGEVMLLEREFWTKQTLNSRQQNPVYQLPARGTSILKNTQSQIWIGTIFGLYLAQGDSLIKMDLVKNQTNVRIEALLQLPDGRMVAGTKGAGIIIWDETDTLQITQADGLTTNMTENLHLDNKNNLWVGTLSGANRISFTSDTSYTIDQFTTLNGLPSNEINKIISSDDKVFLATNGGLISLKNDSLTAYSIPPEIISITLAQQRDTNLTNLHLPYFQNDITVSYITLDYIMDGTIDYRYRINSSEWNTTKNREINLLNLSPNHYQIEIQSLNLNRQWSTSAHASFTIHPAWWNTRWARIAGGLSIIALAYLGFRNRMNHLKKENNLMQEINEMERSALNAQMNPHFIFNCLNSIQSFIINNEKEKASEYLSDFAKLVRSTLYSSQQSKVTLYEEISLLKNYLKLEQMRFKNLLQYSFEVDKTIDLIAIKIPTFLIQPLIENAIVHGVQSSTKSGIIKIAFTKVSQSLLKISVEDNGPGMMTQNHLSHHKSAALKITKRRIQLMDGNKNINSFEIENIVENGEIKGARAILLIAIESTPQPPPGYSN